MMVECCCSSQNRTLFNLKIKKTVKLEGKCLVAYTSLRDEITDLY